MLSSYNPINFIALIIFLVLLSACQTSTSNKAVQIWRCESLGLIEVVWVGLDAVEVNGDNQNWKLKRVMSGSGARYSDGMRELWEHQGSIHWAEPDGEVDVCVQP